MQADLMAYDKNGQLSVLVEVKKKLGTSSEWAAKMRRNLFAHGSLPKTPYFLLALPDRFYLWKNDGNAQEIIQPSYEIDATPFLKPLFERFGLSPEDLSGISFELVIASWFDELMLGDATASNLQPNRDWLIDSGLLEAIKESRLVFGAEI